MATQPQGDIFSQLAAGQTPPPAQSAQPNAPSSTGDIFSQLAAGKDPSAPNGGVPSKPASQDNWSNWSPDQPLTSYGAATRSAIGGLAQDTLNVVKGAAQLIDPRPQSDEEQQAFHVAGLGGLLAHRLYSSVKGAVSVSPTEMAAAIHDINQSKDPTGTYLKMAQRDVSQLGAQTITALATEGAVKAVPKIAAPISDAASSAASGVKNAVTDVTQGAEKAQAPAQAALRSGAKASAADAGVAVGDTSGSIRSLLDQPIEDLATKERATYDTINDASGTDLKSLYDLRSKLQDYLEDPTQIANEEKLQSRLDQTEAQIKTGEAHAIENGVDPDTLDEAKEMTKQRYAMEDVNKNLFNKEGVINGNIEHGAPETIDVNSAIRQAENLDKPSKFAPRGTPSRLEQAFGEDGAAALKQGLYDAQKAGQTALSRQRIALMVGKYAGLPLLGGGLGALGYEMVKSH